MKQSRFISFCICIIAISAAILFGYGLFHRAPRFIARGILGFVLSAALFFALQAKEKKFQNLFTLASAICGVLLLLSDFF